VINPLAGAGFFEGDEVFRLFDDANQAFVAPRTGADLANRFFRETVADFAALGFAFNVADSLGQCHSLIRLGL
jgi:hypothetical protein